MRERDGERYRARARMRARKTELEAGRERERGGGRVRGRVSGEKRGWFDPSAPPLTAGCLSDRWRKRGSTPGQNGSCLTPFFFRQPSQFGKAPEAVKGNRSVAEYVIGVEPDLYAEVRESG